MIHTMNLKSPITLGVGNKVFFLTLFKFLMPDVRRDDNIKAYIKIDKYLSLIYY